MKDVESGISSLKEVRQNVVRGIRERLDALSPEQRLHVVIGMFGILVVLFLYCIWQTVTDIADRKESTNIVIEHIDSPRKKKRNWSSRKAGPRTAHPRRGRRMRDRSRNRSPGRN